MTVTPRAERERGTLVGKFGASEAAPKLQYRRVGFGSALALGWHQTVRMVQLLLETLRDLFTGALSPRNLGGLLAIGEASGQSAEEGPFTYLSFLAFLSVNLAVLNLLPIPILDGGHLMFLAIEAVRGRPLSLEARIRLSHVGLIIVVGLMLWANGNDVVRLVERYFARWEFAARYLLCASDVEGWPATELLALADDPPPVAIARVERAFTQSDGDLRDEMATKESGLLTIPMIIGNTHDETRSLIGRGDPTTFDLTWEALPARLEREMRVDIAGTTVVAPADAISTKNPAVQPRLSQIDTAAVTPNATTASVVPQPQVTTRSGASSMTVSPNVCSMVTGKAPSSSEVSPATSRWRTARRTSAAPPAWTRRSSWRTARTTGPSATRVR